MSTTDTNICNQALGRLGQEQILAITDAGVAGRACQLFYEMTRDEVLRSHRWNFATSRVALTQYVDAPVFGWTYAYVLPSDFIRALEVNDSEDGLGDPWAIESGKLLTDQGSVNLVYIRREVDVAKWDPIFCEAVSLKLAAKLATVLRGSSAQIPDLVSEYERVTAPLARRIDANEGMDRQPLMPLRSRFINARTAGA